MFIYNKTLKRIKKNSENAMNVSPFKETILNLVG